MFETWVQLASNALRWLKLPRSEKGEILIAIGCLARSRWSLSEFTPSEMGFSGAANLPRLDVNDLARAHSVGRAISRAARIVPWRSDCLVQARAAQAWLTGEGIASQIRLGARRLPDGAFGAHAWLVCGQDIITGGDVSEFQPFT
ncbi:lasso peptide biosynthesis B2 protein [Sedimentimonas flavescens]|uniref:Lasso peptide biosynthesis B2 protein n=1 Tax=Sedimentimonas flavescens TaxID=2851012 RepID=A0ABT2ZV92_9RHOB|nr:lasso peptide biosynthesis B2 protein [Sedimentimonas flavescens]MCV2877661.1 lasso peptide biosynthesis B2 protein [Sedimentimonas flavescens]